SSVVSASSSAHHQPAGFCLASSHSREALSALAIAVAVGSGGANCACALLKSETAEESAESLARTPTAVGSSCSRMAFNNSRSSLIRLLALLRELISAPRFAPLFKKTP